MVGIAAICLILKLQFAPLGMGGGKITVTDVHVPFPPE
jgi:hypothetical protein